MQKINKVPRKQPGRGWWAHDAVYNKCQQAGICSLFQYPGGCQRGAKCPFQHVPLKGDVVIDGKVYNTATMAPGTSFPKSFKPPVRPRKKAKTENAQWYGDLRPGAASTSSSSSAAQPIAHSPPKLTLPPAPECLALESPVLAAAAAPSPRPSGQFLSPQQELTKLRREVDRLQRRADAIAALALSEEEQLDSDTTARCYRFEYLQHPTRQKAGSLAYHVRYRAVAPHALGYNDQVVSKRNQAQQDAHSALYAELISAMTQSACFKCRACSTNLNKADEMLPCVRCYSVLYCSPNCARADAPMHAFGCFYHPGYHLRCEQAADGRAVYRGSEVHGCFYVLPPSPEKPAVARSVSGQSATTTPVRGAQSPAAEPGSAHSSSSILSYTDAQIVLETQAYQYAWSQELPDGADEDELKNHEGYATGAAERSALVAQLRAGPSAERTNALAAALAAEHLNVLSAESTATPDPDRLEIAFGHRLALIRTPAYQAERASVVAANDALASAIDQAS